MENNIVSTSFYLKENKKKKKFKKKRHHALWVNSFNITAIFFGQQKGTNFLSHSSSLDFVCWSSV